MGAFNPIFAVFCGYFSRRAAPRQARGLEPVETAEAQSFCISFRTPPRFHPRANVIFSHPPFLCVSASPRESVFLTFTPFGALRAFPRYDLQRKDRMTSTPPTGIKPAQSKSDQIQPNQTKCLPKGLQQSPSPFNQWTPKPIHPKPANP